MTKYWIMRLLWIAGAGGVVIVSAISGGRWLGQICYPYLAGHWAQFLAYAVITAVPAATWRTRGWVLFCLAILSAGACGLPHLMFGWPAEGSDSTFPDLFGVAAGILLGLNVRTVRNPGGAISIREMSRGARVHGRVPLETCAPLTLQDVLGKEKS